MFSLTLGFEMLRRNQVERSRMSACHFRLYNNRPLSAKLLRSCLLSCIAAFAPWSFYDFNPAFKTYALLFETSRISFFKPSLQVFYKSHGHGSARGDYSQLFLVSLLLSPASCANCSMDPVHNLSIDEANPSIAARTTAGSRCEAATFQGSPPSALSGYHFCGTVFN